MEGILERLFVLPGVLSIMALSIGLAQQALVDPRAVPADLLGETIVLIYRGLLASTEE